MHSIQLASSILKGKWLVDPQFAISQGSILANILNRTNDAIKSEPDAMSAFAIDAKDIHGVRHSYYSGFDKAPKNSVAVISLKGALMKGDQYCGSSGMATIGKIIKSANSHHNIDAIVLHVDSPGGTVDGTEALANIVKSTEKPIIAWVDGLMASAALWIGSSADEVIASTDTDEIGSVGVLMSFMDIQPYYEKKGVKFHTITASTSAEKVKLWEELKAGNYETYIKENLDPLDEKFMSVVRENRPKVSDEHLTGKVFFARDVMNIFVDSIGSLEDAILRASELSEQNTSNNNFSNSNNNSMKQFTKVNSALGVDALESADDSVSLNEGQLQLVETGLAEVDTVKGELSTAQDSLATAITEKETAETALADSITAGAKILTDANTAAEATLATAISGFDGIDKTVADATSPEEKVKAIRTLLAAKPGTSNDGIKDEDETLGADTAWERIDALEHNQNVD